MSKIYKGKGIKYDIIAYKGLYIVKIHPIADELRGKLIIKCSKFRIASVDCPEYRPGQCKLFLHGSQDYKDSLSVWSFDSRQEFDNFRPYLDLIDVANRVLDTNGWEWTYNELIVDLSDPYKYYTAKVDNKADYYVWKTAPTF